MKGRRFISVYISLYKKPNPFVLLPRDAMHSTDYAVARCPSVCPSVYHTPVLWRYGWTYHQTCFTIGSHTILVFPHQTLWQHSDGDPLTGASNAGAMKNIAIFDQYLALSRKRYKTGPQLQWNTNMDLYMPYRKVSFWMILSDLELVLRNIRYDAILCI